MKSICKSPNSAKVMSIPSVDGEGGKVCRDTRAQTSSNKGSSLGRPGRAAESCSRFEMYMRDHVNLKHDAATLKLLAHFSLAPAMTSKVSGEKHLQKPELRKGDVDTQRRRRRRQSLQRHQSPNLFHHKSRRYRCKGLCS